MYWQQLVTTSWVLTTLTKKNHRRLVAEFKKENGIDLSADKMALQRLKDAAEKAKRFVRCDFDSNQIAIYHCSG